MTKTEQAVQVEAAHKRMDFGSHESARITFVATINGKTFGYDAEVYVRTGGFFLQDGRVEVEAGQPSIGNSDPRIAQIRAKLYERAAITAAQIKRALDQGEDIFSALDTTEAEVMENHGVIVEPLPHLCDTLKTAAESLGLS